jgi:hypothetical protein
VRTLRTVLMMAVLAGAGVGACYLHRAVTSWEGAGNPSPAKQRELDILQDYGLQMGSIFGKHGRVMTPECEAEQEELRRETRRKLEALAAGK